MTKSLPQKFASLIIVLKKLESKVEERQIVRDNSAALISHSPPSPLGGFFGTTRVNDLASDLSVGTL